MAAASSSETVWERRVATIFMALTVSFMGWLTFSAHKSEVRDAALSEKVGGLERQIIAINAATKDRYTSNQAILDFARTAKEIDDLRNRVTRLENESFRERD